MSLSKPKYTPSYDFPEEILSEIFKRLPVKSVLRCGAVQKSWYHIIRSRMFVTLHLNHQKLTAHDNPRYLLFHNVKTHMFTVYSDDNQFQEYCSVEYPFDFDINEWYALSNGLVCVSSMAFRKPNYDPNLYIWNPLVQIYTPLGVSPLSVFTHEEIGWMAGYLPEVDDYVVVNVVKLEPDPSDPDDPGSPDPYEIDPHSAVIGVYSLKTRSWKAIYQDDFLIFGMCTDQSVFVNGTAFWVATDFDQQYIMYFNTRTEVLRRILVPDWFGLQDRQLDYPVFHQFGQSIAYFVLNDESRHLDIWVLKEDEIDVFSWEKLMSVDLSENVRADVLGLRNSGEPILTKSNNLISYDLDTHEPYEFISSCDCLTLNFSYKKGSKPPFIIKPFVETLLWRDKRKCIALGTC
ncbi:F-box/kelch-repeat protein At3g23880-like [Daucus carota subsp. sativus]|uniref:F-box/kelch-repeat protein At3g23880-like n=1 Tax=Daucus carota subsp. sativus TaxID=79200 RepID=UPI0007EFEECA|nr:PREDICTED: F-box/kelch-repeat protein At3g23880-like [Daucus carota subsp. sativus]